MMAGALLVALEYAAPESCPRQEQFWESVVHAAPDLQLASEGATRSYRVSIDASTTGFHGELSEAGMPAPRSLAAADCAELVEALALMLVLSTEQAPVAAIPAPADDDVALAAWPPTAPAPTVESVWGPPRRDRDAASVASEPTDTRAVVGGLAWWGAAPDPLVGITVGLQRDLGAILVARLEARAGLGNARAEATYVGLAPQVCARTRRAIVEASTCVGAAVGALQLKGVEYSGGSQSSAWVAPLLGVRASLPLAEPLLIELSLEGEHGFFERDVALKSDGTTFKTPPFSALATLAMGAAF